MEIEVTEGFFLKNEEVIQEQVKRLKSLGVTLALDDFGTGYSSLQYLRNYPFDTLKIDRSFVQELPDSESSVGLVKAIVSMGSSLGMKIVSEGVETKQQADFLIAEGCSIFQGYLYAKPMAEADFQDWLKKYKL